MRRFPRVTVLTAAAALVLPLSACGSGDADGGKPTSGPIDIWYSTNEQEQVWAKATVDAWNAEHTKEKVTAKAVPSGKSTEDVIGAAITAGNTPCLVYNTAPAAVAAFQKQGGLVNLSDTFGDAESFIKKRSGGAADGFRSPDGKLYQVPWKTNPFMLYYNKDVFKKAGLDAENPKLSTYDDVLAAAKKIKSSKAAKFTLYPPATSDYTNALFDFYPLYLANSGGTQLVKDKKATFTSDAGRQTLGFWQQMYAGGYSSPEAYSGDMWAGPFADGVAAMGIAGPWGKGQFDGKVKYGVVPLPTAEGIPADKTSTFADSKNVGLFTSCKHKRTAWEFAKFSMSAKNDAALLEETGQFPTRSDVAAVAGAISRTIPSTGPSPTRCRGRWTCRTSPARPRCGRRSAQPGKTRCCPGRAM
ncbi:sugar ABC transporter substrate-binding protein [Streptomyces antimycoticus]|uniref:Sugar ABC transporter substrate-binding protein n=1 Tax=Streptomyces antimycoticus TaxID=68175 RepID=A0A4D4KIY5_9ACTN|nr:sugar ABC transporter substrate-binding protein [Streptomyces antimycoticus]GDY48885.1 sugar ABC transporter substrate-binding protein [Streptomyces antimycoticus]